MPLMNVLVAQTMLGRSNMGDSKEKVMSNSELGNPCANADEEMEKSPARLRGVLEGMGDAVIGMATDVYRARALPLAVVRPASVEDLQLAVRTATAAGIAVYTRGGGASYTDGYLPTRADSILIDMGGLDRIVEINEADGYVTVEAGVTWASLRDALAPRGMRTPFFGPFSGIAATVGGSLSQHAVSHGSGGHGISAQSLISLDVVTADGALLRTGAAARALRGAIRKIASPKNSAVRIVGLLGGPQAARYPMRT